MKSILLMENDQSVSEKEAVLLKINGFQVFKAESLEEALSFCDGETYVDIALIDISDGIKFSGIKTALSILEKHWFPILFLYSHKDIEKLDEALTIPVCGIVDRESDERAILFSIEKAIGLPGKSDLRDSTTEKVCSIHKKVNFMMDSVPVLIAYLNTDLVYKYVNGAYEKILGLSPLTLIGKKAEEVLSKETYKKSFPNMQKALFGEQVTFENRLLDKNKNEVILEVTYVPEFSADKVVGFVVLGQNITDLKNAEYYLKESEERFNSALDAVNDGLWDWHVPSGKAFFSERYYSLLGYENQEFEASYDSWKELVHPDDIADVESILEKSVKDGKGFNIDMRMKTKAGTWLWVCTRGKVVAWDRDGRAMRSIGTLSDISQRKNIEEVRMFLLERGWTSSGEDFFQALARFLSKKLGMEYVCIDRLKEKNLEAETVAIYNNGEFEENVQYALKDTPCGSVVGKTICFFPSEVRKLFPKDIVLQELKAESYAGTTLWSSKGDPIGLIALVGDKPIATNKTKDIINATLHLVAIRAARELERKIEEESIRGLLKEKEILLSELQHRVKNNLNVLHGLLNLESEKIKDQRLKSIFSSAQSRIRSMAIIYERLYKSADVGKVDLHNYVKDLSFYLFDAYALDKDRVRLVTEVDEIYMDLKRSEPIGLILNELITNSLKHAGSPCDDCVIKVSLKKNEKDIELSVTDDGPGFPEGFDPEKAKSMGMKIVSMLANQIGGNMRLVGNNGTGTSVSINFSE